MAHERILLIEDDPSIVAGLELNLSLEGYDVISATDGEHGLRIAGERELASGSRLKLGRVELMFRASDGGGAAPSAKRRGRWRLMEWLRPLFPRSSQAVVEEV